MGKSSRLKKEKSLIDTTELDRKQTMKRIEARYNQQKLIGRLFCKLEKHLYLSRNSKSKSKEQFKNAGYFVFVSFIAIYFIGITPLQKELIVSAYLAITTISFYYSYQLLRKHQDKNKILKTVFLILYTLIIWFSLGVLFNVL